MPIGTTFNWDDHASRSYEETATVLPNGYYRVMVKDVKGPKEGKNKAGQATLRLQVNLAVIEPLDFKGSVVVDYFNLPTSDTSPENLPHFKRFLDVFQEALGIDEDMRGPELDPDGLWIGQECYARIETQDYEGRPQTRITRYLAELPRNANLVEVEA